jgi:hypothetical protein
MEAEGNNVPVVEQGQGAALDTPANVGDQVDVEQQIMSNLLSMEGEQEIVPVDPIQERVIGREEPPVDKKPAEALPYNPIWDYMAERARLAGSEYQPPEFVKTRVKPDGTELTPQEEYDILLSEIATSARAPVNDPFIEDYVQAKEDPEFDLSQWIESRVSKRSILEADDAAFMKHYLKEVHGKSDDRPYGLTEEAIEETIKKMDNSGILTVEAIKGRDSYRKMLEQADHAERELRLSQQQERQAVIQANQQKLISELYQRKLAQKDIYGMPLSEAQKREFQDFFQQIMSLDPQSGVPKLHQYLSNDDALYDAVFLMYLRDKGMRDFVSGVKEEVKQNYIDKLDIRPKDVYQRTPVEPTPVDLSKLMQPEDS